MCTAYVHSLCCFCFMDPAFSKVGEISTFNFAGLGTQANLSTDFMEFIFHSDRMRPRLHSKCIWHAGDPAKMLALGLQHSHITVSGCFWKITGATADHSYLHDSHAGACSTHVQSGVICIYTCEGILMSTVSTAALLPRRWIYLSICEGEDLQNCEQGQGPVPSDTQTSASPFTISSINFQNPITLFLAEAREKVPDRLPLCSLQSYSHQIPKSAAYLQSS